MTFTMIQASSTHSDLSDAADAVLCDLKNQLRAQQLDVRQCAHVQIRLKASSDNGAAFQTVNAAYEPFVSKNESSEIFSPTRECVFAGDQSVAMTLFLSTDPRKKIMGEFGFPAVGPYSIAQKIDTAEGTLLKVSGNIGIDASGQLGADVCTQTQYILNNIQTIFLKAVFPISALNHVDVYLPNMSHREAVEPLLTALLSHNHAKPTIQWIPVDALPKGALVEITPTAFKANGASCFSQV